MFPRVFFFIELKLIVFSIMSSFSDDFSEYNSNSFLNYNWTAHLRVLY